MKKQKLNLARARSHKNSGIKQNPFLSSEFNRTSLTPWLFIPQYLPLVAALYWAYPTMALADDECGVISGSSMQCAAPNYDGITYYPTADFSWTLAPALPLPPLSLGEGL